MLSSLDWFEGRLPLISCFLRMTQKSKWRICTLYSLPTGVYPQLTHNPHLLPFVGLCSLFKSTLWNPWQHSPKKPHQVAALRRIFWVRERMVAQESLSFVRNIRSQLFFWVSFSFGNVPYVRLKAAELLQVLRSRTKVVGPKGALRRSPTNYLAHQATTVKRDWTTNKLVGVCIGNKSSRWQIKAINLSDGLLWPKSLMQLWKLA